MYFSNLKGIKQNSENLKIIIKRLDNFLFFFIFLITYALNTVITTVCIDIVLYKSNMSIYYLSFKLKTHKLMKEKLKLSRKKNRLT